MDSESIKETAKATQEVARATGKGIDVAEKVGRFIANHIGGTLDQGLGIFEDKLKYYRAENQLRFISRYNELANTLGLQARIQPVPLKYALPLLEAASLEDDDYLQSLWVNLLINASDEQNTISIQRSHISILEQLTSLEAMSLNAIYSIDTSNPEQNAVATANLPLGVELFSEREINNEGLELEAPSEEVMLALANLARLRLIALPMTFGGGEVYSYVNHTLLGKRFINACTISL